MHLHIVDHSCWRSANTFTAEQRAGLTRGHERDLRNDRGRSVSCAEERMVRQELSDIVGRVGNRSPGIRH